MIEKGMCKTKLYRVWIGMKTRCYNRNYDRYKDYGGRGIKVCNEWLNDFMAFFKWSIINGYEESLTIDRIDNNGNYEPNNCRFITRKKQANNRRTNHLITYHGETHTIKEWSEITGIHKNTIKERINKNWDIEKVFQKPKRK